MVMDLFNIIKMAYDKAIFIALNPKYTQIH